MSSMTLARFASDTVMGAQVYENAIDARADEALRRLSPSTRMHRTVVRSLRSSLGGNRRVPMGLLLGADPRVRRELARWLYPGHGPVHRMKVGLPPSPRGDILTLHDTGPWRYPDEGEPVPAAAQELRRADVIVTVSQFSADEIVHLFDTREPIVIPNGVDHARFADAAPLSGEELDALGISRPYVLTSGGASLRKNLKGLAEAWPLVRSARNDLTLVMTGPQHPHRDALFGNLSGVLRLGRVADSLLPRLLAGSSALVIPSLYEGFGLPAIEGMAAGVPVVAVDASSLPEVLGGTGVLTDGSPDSLAEGMMWATSDDTAIRTKVVAARERSLEFTWERSAAAHARVWAGALG